jgi:hypothetical protein
MRLRKKNMYFNTPHVLSLYNRRRSKKRKPRRKSLKIQLSMSHQSLKTRNNNSQRRRNKRNQHLLNKK